MDSAIQYLRAQAVEIAKKESEDNPPLFSILTGSVAQETASKCSDIDILFITDSDSVSYRYYLRRLTGIRVRTEVGRIPRSYLEEILSEGYSDEVSTGIREQIRRAVYLSGDKSLAHNYIRRFSDLKPKRSYLGELIVEAGQSLKAAKASLERRSVVTSIQKCDLASSTIWRLLFLIKHAVATQKDKHEVQCATNNLNNEELKKYYETRRVEGIDKDVAARTLKETQRLLKVIFRNALVSEKLLDVLEEI